MIPGGPAKGESEIVGLIDHYRKPGEKTFEYPVLGGVPDLPRLIESHFVSRILVAIGDEFERFRIAQKVKSLCSLVNFPNVIHPRGEIGKDVLFGVGNYVGGFALLSASTRIGDFCRIAGGAHLSHDVIIEDGSGIVPEAFVGGKSKIGRGSMVLVGATVIEKITIGENSVVAVGATVVRDVPPNVLVAGTPAKVKRERNSGWEKIF